MTITEFLLARIRDDEEGAQLALREGGPGQSPWRLDVDDEYWLMDMSPARALAECEAKRAIVHQQEAWDQDPTLLWVVQNLALPYVSHEDYQPEWDPRGRH